MKTDQKTITLAVDLRSVLYQVIANRGIGQYIKNFFKALGEYHPEIKLFFLIHDKVYKDRLDSFFNGVLASDSYEVFSYKLEMLKDVDLLFIPDPMSIIKGYSSPFNFCSSIPTSVLFHDFIPLDFPSCMDGFSSEDKSAYFKRLEQIKILKPQILTNSRFTKERVKHYLGIEEKLVCPIMAGINEDAVLEEPDSNFKEQVFKKYGIRKRFFITVGSCDLHKNFYFSLTSFLSIQEKLISTKREELQLVVIGDLLDPYKQYFKKLLQEKNINDVIFTDFVAPEELACFYSSAIALLYPSKIEGFGFPVLEAMANNCPVITNYVSSIPEIAGEFAVYVKDGDVDGYMAAMEKLLLDGNFREKLRYGAKLKSQEFNWKTVVDQAVIAWKKLLQEKSSANLITQFDMLISLVGR